MLLVFLTLLQVINVYARALREAGEFDKAMMVKTRFEVSPLTHMMYAIERKEMGRHTLYA